MDKEKSVEFFEHFRRIAQRKQASGCKSCQMEGRMLMEQIDEMEASVVNPSSDKHGDGQ